MTKLAFALSTVLLCGVFQAPPTAAQDNLLDLRFLELDDNGDRTYQNFIYSRSLGERFSFEALWLSLPQVDDYQEVAVGLGYKALRVGEVDLRFLGYFSVASDDEYVQPALLALDTEGKLTGAFFLLHYAPLGDEGIHQWLIDPAEVQYNVRGPVSVGVSGYFYRPQGGSWLRKVGPKVAVSDRLGSSELTVRWVNDGGGVEVQLRRVLFF